MMHMNDDKLIATVINTASSGPQCSRRQPISTYNNHCSRSSRRHHENSHKLLTSALTETNALYIWFCCQVSKCQKHLQVVLYVESSNRRCQWQKKCQTESYAAVNSLVFKCALKVEIFVTGDREFHISWCRDIECLGLEVDRCRRLIEQQLTGGSQEYELVDDNEASDVDVDKPVVLCLAWPGLQQSSVRVWPHYESSFSMQTCCPLSLSQLSLFCLIFFCIVFSCVFSVGLAVFYVCVYFYVIPSVCCFMGIAA